MDMDVFSDVADPACNRQIDSVFNLDRPYDLMALLKQEQRAVMLETLKRELLMKKGDIDKNEDKDTGLEQRFYRTDPDCVAAGKPLVEFDLYTSTVLPLEEKGINSEKHVDWLTTPAPPIRAPDCTQYIPLDYSMHAFEHLEGIRLRKNLSMVPEVGLKSVITTKENINEYGHLIHDALKKNTTSWVLYNMAALYWRIKGDPYQAIECLRRALHYSPRHHKDVALISLGNVLHHARYSNEAAIVVHSSLDVSRELNVNHFTLGNIYAVLAEYNKSVICFENTLKIKPVFEEVAERKHAVLCHAKLEALLESQHISLQKTLSELKAYQTKHDIWQQQQQKLLTEQAKLDEKISQRLAYDAYKMRLANEGVGEQCRVEEEPDGQRVLTCSWTRVKLSLTDYDFITQTKQKLPASPSGAGSERMATIDYNQPQHPPLYKGPLKKAQGMPYLSSDWPSKDECDVHVQKFPTSHEFPTTYLSPENKGFVVKPLLGRVQGLAIGEQHPFPWYPPVCAGLGGDIPEGRKTYDHLASVKDRAKLTGNRIADPTMEVVLLSQIEGWVEGEGVTDGKTSAELAAMTNPEDGSLGRQVTRDEIGQRILTALKQKIGPSWILCNLAAVYWRIVGNAVQALECIRHALYHVPGTYRDVPLVNLANVLYRLGRAEDAIKAMKEALSINELEPESQFFMGNLFAAVGNMSGAIHHYQLALSQDPAHPAAYSSLRIINCYQKYHRAAQSAAPPPPPPNIILTPPPPCVPPGPDGKPAYTNANTETHFICSRDKDVERCHLDRQRELCHMAHLARTGAMGGIPQGGDVRQHCSMTPMFVEQWPVDNEGGGSENIHDPSDHHGNFATSTSTDSASADPDSPFERCPGGQLFAAPLSDTLGGAKQFQDLGRRLEGMIEYYRQNGVCSDEECDNLLVQTTQNHRPHILLQMIDGTIQRSLVFSDVVITSADCLIFNDGHRSLGCDRKEFSALAKDWSKHQLRREDILNFFNKERYSSSSSGLSNAAPVNKASKILHATNLKNKGNTKNMGKKKENNRGSETNRATDDEGKGAATSMQAEATVATESIVDATAATNIVLEATAATSTVLEATEVVEATVAAINEAVAEATVTTSQTVITLVDRATNEAEELSLDLAKSDDISGDSLSADVKQMLEDVLVLTAPDPLHHVVKPSVVPARPTLDKCRSSAYSPVDFQQLFSYWVSVATKVTDVRSSLTLIDSLRNIDELSRLYSPETGLKDTLLTLGGLSSPPLDSIATVAQRLTAALAQNSTSWIVNNLASLYWRVIGRADRAIDCIIVAYHFSPPHAQDIALLGLTNILQKCNKLDDAMLVTALAIDAAPNIVTSHFMMANLYAAKGDIDRASTFYESTLGLQPSFSPAKERLFAIRCQQILGVTESSIPTDTKRNEDRRRQ